jgi:cbb3-type cytochrome oxidase subunit 3
LAGLFLIFFCSMAISYFAARPNKKIILNPSNRDILIQK